MGHGAVALVMLPTTLNAQTPVGTVFTYQGHLRQAGVPVDATADFDFILWDADTGGNQIGSTVTLLGVAMTDGGFTVELDCGIDALNGDQRWLEVTVEGTMLSPRLAVTGAPYALQTRGLFVDDDGNIGIGQTSASPHLSCAGLLRR